MLHAYQNSLRTVDSLPKTLVRRAAKAEELQGEVPSFEELDQIQDSLAPSLKTDQAEDGCYARAQLLAKELKKRGLSHGKLFVYSTYRSLKFKEIPWFYHVATVALGEKNGETSAYVMDPSISDDPIAPDQWLGKFQGKGHVLVTLHDSSKYQNGILGSRDFDKNSQRAVRDLQSL